MEDWLKDQLSSCLNFTVPDEMINYILSMKVEEVGHYLGTLLDLNKIQHRETYDQIKRKLAEKKTSKQDSKKGIRNGSAITEKREQEKDDTVSIKESQGKPHQAPKKKVKHSNVQGLNALDPDSFLLKGRHHCDCQASRHKLVNNCLNCGRIVCEQEGSGPCLYCGNLVCSEEEEKLIRSSTKKGDNLKKSLSEQNRPKGWEKALAQRNRLLEYDKTSEKRTIVIDDELDYFKANSVWLSDEERKKLGKMEQELREKKFSSRSKQKIALDIFGRQFVSEPQSTKEMEEEIMREISESSVNSMLYDSQYVNYESQRVTDEPAPKFVLSATDSQRANSSAGNYDGIYNRVQDKELLEMTDMRHCLSMHQPWASLLVAGIKKHEGRSWYTSHRGRLWIASTAKPVDMDEVKRLEHFYRDIYKDKSLEFPSQYPVACLLGCVSVQDCLPQEEYRKRFPDGESDSPFVFICTTPEQLPINFPIKGQHKIYKLDAKIHTAAIKSLFKAAKLQSNAM